MEVMCDTFRARWLNSCVSSTSSEKIVRPKVRGQQKIACGPNLACHLFLWMKSHGRQPCLVVFGCLLHCSYGVEKVPGLCNLKSLKYWLSGPLTTMSSSSCHGGYCRQSMEGAWVLKSLWCGKVPGQEHPVVIWRSGKEINCIWGILNFLFKKIVLF